MCAHAHTYTRAALEPGFALAFEILWLYLHNSDCLGGHFLIVNDWLEKPTV